MQTRELNQLQTILQKQVEKFGDVIFRRGTIVDGCNFRYNENLPYVKLNDIDLLGYNVIPSLYVGSIVTCVNSGLRAKVIDYADGFEATDPNLKTLYLQYLNTGDDGETEAFSSGDTLKVTDILTGVYDITINNGGLAFSNSDSVVVTPAIIANVTSGSFTNNMYITNNTANLQIIGVDSSTLAQTNQVILRLKPRDADLANSSANSLVWTFANNDSIRDSSNTVSAKIEGIIGSGFEAKILTNGAGSIIETVTTSRGKNYVVPPTIRVRSSNNSSGLSSLNLTARNYRAEVKVASVSQAVGNAYSFGVSEGWIYQKGFFLRVDSQNVVVDRYSNAPDGVSVVFETTENIVDANIDPDLLDNAYTSRNKNAHGANRLKLTPTLKVISKDAAKSDPEYFALVSWSEGNAFRQQQYTAYSKIGDEMARRMYAHAGNFVVDPFLVTTRSPINPNYESNTVSVIVDPGTAYISGFEISTSRNFSTNVSKAINTQVTNNHVTSLNYGNFLPVNELGGTFQFSTGDTIDLYDTAKSFISNTTAVSTANLSPVGTKIGTARIRSMINDPTVPQQFRLSLFDIQMGTGYNFENTKAVYYNGTAKGIADVVQTYSPDTNSYYTALIRPNAESLLFDVGSISPQNITNVDYTYRTIDQTVTISNTGTLTKDISASVNEFYPYSGILTDEQMDRLFVVPNGGDLVCNVSVTGNLAVVSTSNVVTGSGTTFLTDFEAGDYIQLYSNAASNGIRRIVTIANNTSLTLDANSSFTNASCIGFRCFPNNVPVPFGYRSGLSANVNANSNILTLNFGMRFSHSGSIAGALACIIERRNITQATKSAQRNRFVKIRCANNAGGINGPWCLGVPDVFRLRNVYIGNSSVNTSSNNATTNFYVDHNQYPSHYDLSYLYLKPKAKTNPDANSYLLVEFDYFTTTSGSYTNITSYVSANTEQRMTVDALPLSNLTSSINSFEIPQVYSTGGLYYDLWSQLDFRPVCDATATPNTVSTNAPVNPVTTLTFGNTASPANDKKFPVPGTTFTCSLTEFLGRTDSVFINTSGEISVASGTPAADITKQLGPAVPADSINIGDISQPPYPSLPIVRSYIMDQIVATGVSNENYLKNRLDRVTIGRIRANDGLNLSQPRVYTMADIGKIDRRLKDVEYYVALNLLESDIKNRVIPSSIDPSLDRFKFGFFVDDFSTFKFNDTNNPQYAAFIEDNCLVPEKLLWNVRFEPVQGPPTYIDSLVIEQNLATIPNLIEPPCLPNTPTANTFAYRLQGDSRSVGSLGHYYMDTYELTMAAAASSQATLYFYNYDKPVNIEIYQGSTLIASTNNAVAMTSTEKTRVVSSEMAYWFADQSSVFLKDPVLASATGPYGTTTFATWAGKISWFHNPSNGRNYTILVNKGLGSTRWRYVVEYPIDRSTVGCPTDETGGGGGGTDGPGGGGDGGGGGSDGGGGDGGDGCGCGDGGGGGGE